MERQHDPLMFLSPFLMQKFMLAQKGIFGNGRRYVVLAMSEGKTAPAIGVAYRRGRVRLGRFRM